MAYKTEYSQYDNKTGLISTVGSLDTVLTALPTEGDKMIASDRISGDGFGQSVAIGNNKIVVAAPNANNNGINSGSVYIYDLNGTNEIKITVPDGAAYDAFGGSVAVGNGKIVIGARNEDDNGSDSGSAYIYDLAGNQLSKITPSDGATNDHFGESVAIGSGRIVVGALYAGVTGAAYIFDLDGNQLAKLTMSGGSVYDYFGSSVAVGSGRIVVGNYGANSSTGEAYIFDLVGNQLSKITPSDAGVFSYFGANKSLAIGNNRIVVTSNNNNAAYIFDIDGNQLSKITPFDGGSSFGSSVVVGSGKIVVGAAGQSGGGSAYIYNTPNIKDIFSIVDK